LLSPEEVDASCKTHNARKHGNDFRTPVDQRRILPNNDFFGVSNIYIKVVSRKKHTSEHKKYGATYEKHPFECPNHVADAQIKSRAAIGRLEVPSKCNCSGKHDGQHNRARLKKSRH